VGEDEPRPGRPELRVEADLEPVVRPAVVERQLRGDGPVTVRARLAQRRDVQQVVAHRPVGDLAVEPRGARVGQDRGAVRGLPAHPLHAERLVERGVELRRVAAAAVHGQGQLARLLQLAAALPDPRHELRGARRQELVERPGDRHVRRALHDVPAVRPTGPPDDLLGQVRRRLRQVAEIGQERRGVQRPLDQLRLHVGVLGDRRAQERVPVVQVRRPAATGGHRQHSREPAAAAHPQHLRRALTERPPPGREPTRTRERHRTDPVHQLVPLGDEVGAVAHRGLPGTIGAGQRGRGHRGHTPRRASRRSRPTCLTRRATAGSTR
jgi:hypothetical protein